ncbi:MAG TPA: FlgD immunoglobulin-like domain containing protein, partial [candidate division Zixibacteria bacterium]|nr:FlgD immunoglobulin-like domain containing protein [candidate division Zixibacteria bacterium]
VMRLPIIASSNARAEDVQLASVTLSNPQAGRINTEYPDVPAKPETFWLSQNYPNPFNPETRIDFAIDRDPDGAAAQHVTLKVYNILGQQVNTLIDADLDVGNYTVQWDGRNASGSRVASGVYLYRLQVNSTRALAKKMILLK